MDTFARVDKTTWCHGRKVGPVESQQSRRNDTGRQAPRERPGKLRRCADDFVPWLGSRVFYGEKGRGLRYWMQRVKMAKLQAVVLHFIRERFSLFLCARRAHEKIGACSRRLSTRVRR